LPSQPVSATFLAALYAGQTTNVKVVVGITAGGQPISGYQNLSVASLTVTANRTNAQRTTISLTINPVPGSFFPAPTDMSSPLAPNGNELVVAAGFIYTNGTIETAPMGVFPIVTVDVATTPSTGLVITVTADDRSWSISRRSLLQPIIMPVDDDGNPTTLVDAATLALLTQNTSGLPPIQYAITPTASLGDLADNYYAPATTYDQGQDPWAAALDIASGVGEELYLNVAGNVECYPMPDPSKQAAPDWVFSDPPVPTAIGILAATRTLTADGVTNDQFVITDSDSAPQQWEQLDSNPLSPTYTPGNGGYSKFGDIPSFVQSSVSDNLQAATLEATTDLLLSLGQTDTISLTSVVNAAVLIDDVCEVTCARLQLSGVMYVVDGFVSTFTSSGTTVYTLRRVYANSSTGQSVPVPSTDGAGYYD
jgi:hypothetical protein